MITIAHLSDIHFGRITHPAIVSALVEEINRADVDLVAVSGDLTQRARPREFEPAAAMLKAFTAPTLVVPGNHDVFPWWRPVRRLTRPLARYRAMITDDLTPTFETDGVAVLGVNSAMGHTVKGGRVGRRARAAMQRFFKPKSEEVFKVLVMHHHLTRIQALAPHDVARHAERTLEIASSVGVDLILCGHLHVSHIEPFEIVPTEHRLVIASAGTATSNRGRKTNRNTNFYNLIRVEPTTFEIEERRYVPAERAFAREVVTTFERTFV